MTLSDLATDLRALNISHLTIQLVPAGYIVAAIPLGQHFSVTATDPDLETAAIRALDLWERVSRQTSEDKLEAAWMAKQPKETKEG
jgi:hypothetical protein